MTTAAGCFGKNSFPSLSIAQKNNIASVFYKNFRPQSYSAKRRVWLAAIAAAVLLAASPTRAASPPIATVDVQNQTLGNKIPADFVGLSIEVSAAGQGLATPPAAMQMGKPSQPLAEYVYSLGVPGQPNSVFFKFMRNLGPGVLRLGGNSQDNTCWNPAAAPHPDWCKGAIDAGYMQLYADAAAASGWNLILGLNLKQNSPTWALDEVVNGVAKEIPASRVLGLEIGNEHDLFARDGSRPAGYTPAEDARDFLNYVQTFQKDAAAKSYPVMGPATCCGWRNPADLAAFLDGVGPANLKLVTVHDYSATTCNNHIVTVEELLAPKLMAKFNDAAKALVAEAHKRNLPIALAETNSASCGGMKGVSNAFASTVWGLDWLFSSAEDGYTGVNFHISYRTGGSAYKPVETTGWQDPSHRWHYRNTAQPLYYAMAMFAQNASGKHLLPAEIQSAANIKAYAVTACADCATEVFVINKDSSASGAVRVHLAASGGEASLLLLRAPSLESLAPEVRYGGVQFDENANLPAVHTAHVRRGEDGSYEFTLPNASAALLTIAAQKKMK